MDYLVLLNHNFLLPEALKYYRDNNKNVEYNFIFILWYKYITNSSKIL